MSAESDPRDDTIADLTTLMNHYDMTATEALAYYIHAELGAPVNQMAKDEGWCATGKGGWHAALQRAREKTEE
jgi:hypothetical protein